MSEASHTPGPWHVNWRHVWLHKAELPDGKMTYWHKIADVAFHSDGGFGVQSANAHLIAAAPELLAALEAVAAAWHAGGSDEGFVFELGGSDFVRRVESLIARAKGHPPDKSE